MYFPAGVLRLQRAAGNRAVARALAESPQMLARCSGGACRCGGACAGSSSMLEEEELLRSASLARMPSNTRQTGRPVAREREA